MAVDPVPHEFSDEAANLLETIGPIKLDHSDRVFVAAHLHHPAAVPGVVRLTAGRADARIGLHADHQVLEIGGGEVEIEVELADVVELVRIDRVIPRVKRLDHATAELPVTAVASA